MVQQRKLIGHVFFISSEIHYRRFEVIRGDAGVVSFRHRTVYFSDGTKNFPVIFFSVL